MNGIVGKRMLSLGPRNIYLDGHCGEAGNEHMMAKRSDPTALHHRITTFCRHMLKVFEQVAQFAHGLHIVPLVGAEVEPLAVLAWCFGQRVFWIVVVTVHDAHNSL